MPNDVFEILRDLADSLQEPRPAAEQWAVIIYNDDKNSFGKATEVLMKALGVTVKVAVDLAVTIDREGHLAIVVGSYDDAIKREAAIRGGGLRAGMIRRR